MRKNQNVSTHDLSCRTSIQYIYNNAFDGANLKQTQITQFCEYQWEFSNSSLEQFVSCHQVRENS